MLCLIKKLDIKTVFHYIFGNKKMYLIKNKSRRHKEKESEVDA